MRVKMVEFQDYRGEGVFPRSSHRFNAETGYDVDYSPDGGVFVIRHRATGAVLLVDKSGAQWQPADFDVLPTIAKEPDAPAIVHAASAAKRPGRRTSTEG